ncbi:hypothetical protein CFU_1490 [Collimonas fungivorans Ter331]|uniref:Uncharacterized protein n=1 Tax=Collimonas fungivorans (strain Ter331) TaxID=1005048 RepID=G0ABB6_COLFT|nr:hypothetical protein CFU_1490 [Collimonas fungivorans Ter331]
MKFHGFKSRRKYPGTACRQEADCFIENNCIGRGIESNRRPVSKIAAMLNGRNNKLPTDTLPMQLRRHEQTAQVPEIFHQHHSGNLSVPHEFEMTAFIAIHRPPVKILIHVLDKLSLQAEIVEYALRAHDAFHETAQFWNILRLDSLDGANHCYGSELGVKRRWAVALNYRIANEDTASCWQYVPPMNSCTEPRI